MHASRTACSRCAPRLRSAPCQRLASSWAASLADAADAPGHRISHGQHQYQQQPRPENQEGGLQASTEAGLPASKPHRHPSTTRNPPGSRPSRGRSRGTGTQSDTALNLFNSVVQTNGDVDKQATVSRSKASAVDEWAVTLKVKEMAWKTDLATSDLQQFNNEVWPQVQKLVGRVPKHLFISLSQYFGEACNLICKNGLTGHSVKMSKMMGDIGKWDLDARSLLVLNLCHVLISDQSSALDKDVVVTELVDLWKSITQLKRQSRRWTALEFALPSESDVQRDVDVALRKAVDPNRPNGMDIAARALAAMFTQHDPKQFRCLLPGLLATVAILSDEKLCKSSAQMYAAPLLHHVSKAFSRAEISADFVATEFLPNTQSSNTPSPFADSKLQTLGAYVAKQWPRTRIMLNDPKATFRLSPTSQTGHAHWLGNYHKTLRVAYRTRNVETMRSTWHQLKTGLRTHSGLRKQVMAQPTFLDFSIFMWCAMRNRDRVQETLQIMNELGIKPTIKTYTAMMHGWKICKDHERIEALWAKMVESGIYLDNAIWTERLSALVELGQHSTSVKALAELHQARKKPSKAAQEAGIEPSRAPIEAVNAVFMGLVRKDPARAYRTLDWAVQEGINPDVRTFNIILQEKFRIGETGSVPEVLQTMAARGVEPDGATFTIILEKVLGTMTEAPVEEQIVAVRQILADIDAAGLKPNLETYGKMLYAVASLPGGGCEQAIDAILASMRSHGMQSFSSHMITILIERISQRSPHNVPAIRAILQEHGLTNVTTGDHVLWERVMSAYAVAGDTTAAMQLFDELAGRGRTPTSLSCLRDLLQCLVHGNKMEDAASVVERVMKSKVNGEERPAERYWRHHFWYLADHHKLIKWDEAPEELRRLMEETQPNIAI